MQSRRQTISNIMSRKTGSLSNYQPDSSFYSEHREGDFKFAGKDVGPYDIPENILPRPKRKSKSNHPESTFTGNPPRRRLTFSRKSSTSSKPSQSRKSSKKVTFKTKSHGLRRPNMRSTFAKRVKEIVMNSVASENAYFTNYLDLVTTAAEAKDATGNQVMWNRNQTAASGGLGAGVRYNLLMHDPVILSAISQNISAVKTTKATIKSYAVSAKLINAGTAPLTVWEYRVRARNNLTLDLTTLLVDGFDNATTGIGTLPTSTTLGATPFNNPAFTAQFKVVKVRKWELKPAQSQWIKYKNERDFSFTQEYIAPDDAANLMKTLKGRDHSVFVMQGSFGYLATNTDGKRYGIVTPNLGIEYQTKVHYSWINDENVSQGSNVYMTGLTAGGPTVVPCPVIINHPDSTITVTTGVRTTAATEQASLPQISFNAN